MIITRLANLCLLLVLSFALIQFSHQARTRQAIQPANTLFMGLNFTSNSQINVDTYRINDGSLVTRQKNIYFALPGVSNKSVRPRTIGYDATRGLVTLTAQHDKVRADGKKVRVNYLFFFDAQNAARKTGIEPYRGLYWDERYDGTIYSYASLTAPSESMDRIFYWTKLCTLSVEDMASPLYACKHKVTGATHPTIPALFSFDWRGGVSSEIDPPTLTRVPILLDSASLNVNLVVGVFGTKVERDTSVPEDQRYSYYVQLARGVSGSTEPSDKSFVILLYSHSWVSGVNLGRNYTITSLAVGARMFEGSTRFYMLGIHNKEKQWYILRTSDIVFSRTSLRITEPDVELKLSEYVDVEHLQYEYKTEQLMFLATHKTSRNRYLVYVDTKTAQMQITKAVGPPADYNYQAMYINKGA